MINALLAVLLPCAQNGLSVRVCAKPVSRLDELRPEFLKIVDFAVEHNPDAAIAVRHGLVATRNINDAQPIETESHVSVLIYAVIVRAAVYRNLTHTMQQRMLDGTIRIEIKEPVYTTHCRHHAATRPDSKRTLF